MVTVGVFLLCRFSSLYEAAPEVLRLVGWVGVLIAIFAATVGFTQTDIKWVIVYSTCSQLGYMMFAIGVSAYPAVMFHLTTHVFFKALLFLGVGSVIHGLHHEQNLFNMGVRHRGLIRALSVTYGLMWLGSLALAGIPLFAGFFSKDLILESVFMVSGGGGWSFYLLGTLAVMLTAVYGFRVIFLAFHSSGEDASVKPVGKNVFHAHESSWVMLLSMLPLAAGAVAAGYALLPLT